MITFKKFRWLNEQDSELAQNTRQDVLATTTPTASALAAIQKQKAAADAADLQTGKRLAAQRKAAEVNGSSIIYKELSEAVSVWGLGNIDDLLSNANYGMFSNISKQSGNPAAKGGYITKGIAAKYKKQLPIIDMGGKIYGLFKILQSANDLNINLLKINGGLTVDGFLDHYDNTFKRDREDTKEKLIGILDNFKHGKAAYTWDNYTLYAVYNESNRLQQFAGVATALGNAVTQIT